MAQADQDTNIIRLATSGPGRKPTKEGRQLLAYALMGQRIQRLSSIASLAKTAAEAFAEKVELADRDDRYELDGLHFAVQHLCEQIFEIESQYDNDLEFSEKT